MNRKQMALRAAVWLAVLTFLMVKTGHAAVPAEWMVSQDVQVSQSGLNKFRLPVEMLGAAQLYLADLRLLDSSGREVPYAIDMPAPVPARALPLERMTATMRNKQTVISGMIPAQMRGTGFQSIWLLTPTEDFLKPITLEGSSDGVHWKTLIKQAPIFKQAGDPQSSTVAFEDKSSAYLRVTLDDSDSPPIRVSQIGVVAAGQPVKDVQEFEAKVLETASDGSHTVLRLQLPADSLPVQSLRFDVSDRTFRRPVRLATRAFMQGEFRENAVTRSSIYRITLGSQKSEQLLMPVNAELLGPQIVVTLENADSPPLAINHIWVRVIPRDVVFDAPAPGVYTLCAGNPTAPMKTYDVAALRGSFAQAAFHRPALGVLQPNLAYQPPAPPELAAAEAGGDIDVEPWKFRKKIALEPMVNQPALWRVELDPESVAHNAGRTASLRLVRGDHQVPYVLDNAGVERSIAPTIEPQSAPPGKSRWLITLPYAGLPVTRLRFSSPDPLFQRTMKLYEIVEESRENPGYQDTRRVPEGLWGTMDAFFGLLTTQPRAARRTSSRAGAQTNGDAVDQASVRVLAQADWTRVNASSSKTLELMMWQRPSSSRIILETDNGDNAAIRLEDIQAYYTAPRLVFRAKPQKSPIYLYYGQDEVAAPQYDLRLIAGELLSTPPQEAVLGSEEALQTTPWWGPSVPSGPSKLLFWIVMTLVVIGLLIIIARLLPEEKSS